MRAIVQKVKQASVKVSDELISEIGQGLLVFVAVRDSDTEKDIDYIKKKIEKLRIFEDDQGKMNLSVEDEGGELLIVSQFTLYGDARKGNRPSFGNSSSAEKAEEY
ncbi:MAG: D-aminoacyl-tRNA deacylase, partial [Anaerococcus sp.]|nr:D-aminoacyl-tRNA deacylase [Anaerococcus sp.]